MSENARIQNWDYFSSGSEHIGPVTQLVLPNTASAQVSELPPKYGPGFLIRVWEPGALYEYGGDNGNVLSITMSFPDNGRAKLNNFNWWGREAN